MTPASFRTAFPAFVDEKDTTIQRHIDASPPYFDVARWDTLYDEGLGCFIAHRIICEAADAKPGSAFGSDVAGKTIGGVSKTRAAAMLMAEQSDPFQRTRYGQRFSYLASQVARGAVAV